MNIYIYMYICISGCINICKYINLCIYIYEYIYMCIYIYIYSLRSCHGRPWLHIYIYIYMAFILVTVARDSGSPYTPTYDTGWRECIGCLKMQVFFCKRATNFRVLLRKMTYKDKASYVVTPPCSTRERSKQCTSYPCQTKRTHFQRYLSMREEQSPWLATACQRGQKLVNV